MKWIDYREALGIGFSDLDKARMLEGKIVALFDGMDEVYCHDENSICRQFFSDIGERNYESYYSWYAVAKCITRECGIIRMISYTIAFSNAARRIREVTIGDYVLQELKTFLDDLRLDYEIMNDEDGFFIFPKGAPELDEANVNRPFAWLQKFPLSRTAMEKALREYSNMVSPSQVADLFRKTLETFGQEFFGKSASLENMKTDFGRYLKEKDVPKELVSNFETTLQMYTNFMNNYAKHHDLTERKLLEFIMYQTGNIIRFIISLSNE